MVTVGIDEVGRGSWAGPLVVGAVILGDNLPGLRDSKQLSKKRRQQLDIEIKSSALATGLGWVQPDEIDSLGLTNSLRLAMERALNYVTPDYDEVIIDGNFNFLSDNPKTRALIRADELVPAVSAASIIAKVARDEYMTQAAKRYPGYGFEQHVGYGTALHLEMLKVLGVCKLHRHSFKPVKTYVRIGT